MRNFLKISVLHQDILLVNWNSVEVEVSQYNCSIYLLHINLVSQKIFQTPIKSIIAFKILMMFEFLLTGGFINFEFIIFYYFNLKSSPLMCVKNKSFLICSAISSKKLLCKFNYNLML